MLRGEKPLDWYCYFIVFLFIYLEWGYDPVIAQNINGIVKTGLMLIGILPLMIYKSFKINNNSFKLFIYLSLIISLSALRDSQIGNSILLFVPIVCAFFITSAYSVEKILNTFCNIITFLAAYSLIVYVIALAMPSVITSFPILPNAFHTPIHNVGLSVIPTGGGVIRNYGITWEPGAFALLLCLAIFGQIVGYKSINKTKISINIIALLSTFSTMGIVVLTAIILITRFKTGEVAYSKNAIVLLLLFLIGSILLFGYSIEIYDTVFAKLSGFSLNEENVITTQARLNAIIYPGSAFLLSPFYGVGYDVFSIINKTLCNSVATNTIVNWFAIIGVALGLPCTYYYFKFVLKVSTYLKLNFLFKVVLVVSFALLISTESLLRISLIYVLIFYGCSLKQFTKHA